MFHLSKSHSAAQRISAATEFIGSFPPATEILIIGASRDAVDDFVRSLARSRPATFGLHRFSLTQLAARLALGSLATRDIVPGTAINAEAIAVRAAYEAQGNHELAYFAPVANFPGFARAVATTLSELRAAGVGADSLGHLGGSGPDNAALLDRFEQQMRVASVADRTLLLRTALEEVLAGVELTKNPMLFLDVPLHSSIEKEFVAGVVAASQRVLFTCPAGDLRTLQNLSQLGAAESGSALPDENSSLDRLGLYLFSETVPTAGKTDDAVVFFS